MNKVMHDLYYSEIMADCLNNFKNLKGIVKVGVGSIIDSNGKKIAYTLAVIEGTKSEAVWPDLKFVGKAKLPE